MLQRKLLCLKKRVARQTRFNVTFKGLTAIQSAVTLDLMCSDWQKSRVEERGICSFSEVSRMLLKKNKKQCWGGSKCKKNKNLKKKQKNPNLTLIPRQINIAKEKKRAPAIQPCLCWELNQIICPSLDLVAQFYSIRLWGSLSLSLTLCVCVSACVHVCERARILLENDVSSPGNGGRQQRGRGGWGTALKYKD